MPRFTLRMAATAADWAAFVLACALLAWALDAIAALGMPALKRQSTLAELAEMALLSFFYFGGSYRFFGTTPGKAIFQLRLERSRSRARVGLVRAWIREVVLKILPLVLASVLSQHPAIRAWLPGAYVLVPCLPVLQAMFFGLFRTDGRMLADLILDTRVVGAARSGRYARWLGALTARRSLAFQACLGLALVGARYAEEARWALARPAALYDRFRPAIVRIEITKLGTTIATGTGFFVSSDGVLVTNDHVLAAALRPGMGASFVLSDGRKLDRFKIGACSDERNIDLCVARLDVAPEVWFRPKPGPVKVGDEALLIGHPLSFDFSLSQGIVSGLRQDKRTRQGNFRVGAEPKPVAAIQFTAPISPGNSGGPVFNRYGELLGVATSAFFSPEATGLNFGIDQAEVFRYLRRVEGWRDPRIESDLILGEHRAEERRLQKRVFAPAFEALSEGRGIDPYYFRHVTLELGSRRFGFWLPRDVMAPAPGDGCRRGTRGDGAHLLCPDYLSDGKIQLELFESPKGQLDRIANIVRPSAFLPYWTALGPHPSANAKGPVDLNAPRVEAFRCERIHLSGIGGRGTLCTQTAYNLPSINSLTNLVVVQRDEDGYLLAAFGVTDSDGFKVRQFQGAAIAARSLEFEGYVDMGLRAARDLASQETRMVPRPSPQ